MADIAQLESALVKADAAGASEDARAIAAEIKRIRAEPTVSEGKYKIGSAGWEDAVKAASNEFNPFSKFLVGFKGSLDDTAARAKQLFGFDLSPDEIQAIKANRVLRNESGAAVAGDIGGQLAMTAAPGMALQRGVGAVTAEVLPRIVAPTTAAAVTGGVQSALTQPTIGNETTMQNVKTGAIGGATGDVAARTVARVAQPIIQSEAVQKLLERGIVPTPGNAAGGFAKSIEDKATSIPIIGDLIQNARLRSVNEFNRAAIQEGMPAGAKATEIGREGVQIAKDKIGAAYDNVYGNTRVSRDFDLMREIAAAKNSTAVPLSDKHVATFDTIVKREVLDRLKPGVSLLATDAKKQIEAGIGKAAWEMKRSTDPQDRALGEALLNARNAFRNLMARNLKADVQQSTGAYSAAADPRLALVQPQVDTRIPELDQLNAAYSKLSDIKTAAKRADAKGGVFTPNQLQRVSKEGSSLKDLADTAQSVLPSNVPDSGTAGRWALISALSELLAPAAAGASALHIGMPYLAAAGAAPLMYSRPGARYMLGDLIPGQQTLAELARKSAPIATQTGIAASQARK